MISPELRAAIVFLACLAASCGKSAALAPKAAPAESHDQPAEQAAPPEGAAAKHTNRLAQETSPYLLLHAHNPVDWYPWGPEAFARAKAEKKPIFLSIGYSSCY